MKKDNGGSDSYPPGSRICGYDGGMCPFIEPPCINSTPEDPKCSRWDPEGKKRKHLI